jgi:hypothetical protein
MPKTTRGWGRGKWRGAPYWRSPSGHSAPTTPSHRPGITTPPRWASAGHSVTSPTAKAATDLIPASHRLRTERLTSPAHCRIFVRRWRRVVLTGQVPIPELADSRYLGLSEGLFRLWRLLRSCARLPHIRRPGRHTAALIRFPPSPALLASLTIVRRRASRPGWFEAALKGIAVVSSSLSGAYHSDKGLVLGHVRDRAPVCRQRA